MKAILVIDMPKNCDECTLNCDGICVAEQEPVHSIVCPLKPLPNKLDANDWHRMFDGTYQEREAKGYGWNACLEEIEE